MAGCMALQKEVTEADEKLTRLYRLVEDGLTDLDEVLKDRLNTLKADRDRAKAALERAKEHSASPIQDRSGVDRTSSAAPCRRISPPARCRSGKLTCRPLIDVIEVDDHQVRIKGSKDLLEKAVLASQTATVRVFADEY